MANDYYVAPAGDISQGLAGIGGILQQAAERRDEMALKEKARAEKAKGQEALLDAYRSKDPSKMMEAAFQYPEISEVAYKGAGMMEDYQRKEADQFAAEVLANPSQAADIAKRRIELLTLQKRDPTHTVQFYQKLQEDPENAMKEMEMGFAMANPKAYEAYREASKPAEAEKGVVVDGKVVSPTTGKVIYEGDEDKGEIRADANGIPRYVKTGEEVFPGVAGAKQREVRADQNGIPRYVDDASPVFPDVVKAPQPPTADQSKAALFAQRALDSSPIIDKLSSDFATLGSLAGKAMPNALKSEDRKLFDQASRDFINAVLRRESGAAISPGEFESAELQYLPQPGDTKAVLDQKKRNRETVAAGLKAEAGAALGALNSQLAQPATTPEGATATNPQTGEKLVFKNGQWSPL